MVGNVIAIILFQLGVDIITTLWIMAAVTGLGCLMVPFSSNVALQNDDTVKKPKPSLMSMIIGISKLIKKKQTFLLSPYLFLQGLNTGYSFGNFPTFIVLATSRSGISDLNQLNLTMNTNIALAFLTYGLGAFIGSILWGKLYDKSHSVYPLVISHVVILISNFSLLIIGVFMQPAYPLPILALLLLNGLLFGLTDSLTNALNNTCCSDIFESNEVPVAFSWYRFCFCLGFIFCSALSAQLPDVTNKGSSPFETHGWLIMAGINILLGLVAALNGLFLAKWSI